MIESRDKWIFGNIKNLIDNKEELQRHETLSMLNRTIRIFKYNNLPETIPQKDLEIILQVGGFATFKKVNDKLYAFASSLGGAPNPYYLPTLSIIANPALKYNASLKIDEECVVMLNDHLYTGLMPMFNKYSSLITEALITLKYNLYNNRIPEIAQADNDNTAKSAEEFFNRIIEGKDYGIVLTKQMFEGLTTHEFSKESRITDSIEAIQYIKGSWYNEIGLRAAFNMKREAINEAEASLNDDILYPTIDVMLECRRIGLEKVNSMFGTNITVELDSIWERARKEDNLTIEQKIADIEATIPNEEGEENEDNRDTDTE